MMPPPSPPLPCGLLDPSAPAQYAFTPTRGTCAASGWRVLDREGCTVAAEREGIALDKRGEVSNPQVQPGCFHFALPISPSHPL